MTDAIRRAALAHQAAEQNWLEAEAAVERLRRGVEAAAARAEERLRFAETLRRTHRLDAHSASTVTAAWVHAERAAAEAARLAQAERVHDRLRMIAEARRAELSALLSNGSAAAVEQACRAPGTVRPSAHEVRSCV